MRLLFVVGWLLAIAAMGWVVWRVVRRIRYGAHHTEIERDERRVRAQERQLELERRKAELDARATAVERARADLDAERTRLGDAEYQRLMARIDGVPADGTSPATAAPKQKQDVLN